MKAREECRRNRGETFHGSSADPARGSSREVVRVLRRAVRKVGREVIHRSADKAGRSFTDSRRADEEAATSPLDERSDARAGLMKMTIDSESDPNLELSHHGERCAVRK